MKREVSPLIAAAAIIAVLVVAFFVFQKVSDAHGPVVHIGKGEAFDMKTGKAVKTAPTASFPAK